MRPGPLVLDSFLIRRSSYTSFGQRRFSTSVSAVWNDTPTSVRNSDRSLSDFSYVT